DQPGGEIPGPPGKGGSTETVGPPPPPDEDDALIGSIVGPPLGAADPAPLRAREAAGARLRSRAKRNPDMLAMIEGVRGGDVAAVLGRERVKALGAPPERELVAGAPELIEDVLSLYGLTDTGVADVLRDHVERIAAKSLYDRRTSAVLLPDSFESFLTG